MREASTDDLIAALRLMVAHAPDYQTWAKQRTPADWERLRMAMPGLKERAETLSRRMIELTARPRANADNEQFAKHLWNLQESLFTFLKFEGVDATNHKAEQAIRPATANRKVWGGNRTDSGAEAQSILMSVIRTTTQRGMEAVNYLSSTLKACFGRRPQLFPDTG